MGMEGVSPHASTRHATTLRERSLRKSALRCLEGVGMLRGSYAPSDAAGGPLDIRGAGRDHNFAGMVALDSFAARGGAHFVHVLFFPGPGPDGTGGCGGGAG